MANFLSFVKGTEYTLHCHNREFAEETLIISSGLTGATYDDIITSGVVYHYVDESGDAYTGDINYHTDTNIYSGAAYNETTSKKLDIKKIVFTPNASHPSTLYLVSGKNEGLEQQIFILDSLGEIINKEQMYYLLGIGVPSSFSSLSYYEKFVEHYLAKGIQAGAEVKTHTI